MGLSEDWHWSDPYYESGNRKMLDRLAFMGLAA